MKYLFVFLTFCLVATACSKDETPTSDDLVGTVWSQTVDDRTDTFYFSLDHQCTVEWQYAGFDAVRLSCRYTYAPPTVTISTLSTRYVGKSRTIFSISDIQTPISNCTGFDNKQKPRTLVRAFVYVGFRRGSFGNERVCEWHGVSFTDRVCGPTCPARDHSQYFSADHAAGFGNKS